MILAIYGAGGLAKEIYDTAQTIGTWEELVFIDDFNYNRSQYDKRVISFDKIIN